ncbi:hypothetical protein PAMP_001974 [Pampus punctatissimus]
MVRSEESETGIQVFDSSGNPVGISKAAGEKNEASPEELSADRSCPPHKSRFGLWPDDPGVVQSLSTAGNDTEGECRGGAAGSSSGWTVILPQRTVRSSFMQLDNNNININNNKSNCKMKAAFLM